MDFISLHFNVSFAVCATFFGSKPRSGVRGFELNSNVYDHSDSEGAAAILNLTVFTPA